MLHAHFKTETTLGTVVLAGPESDCHVVGLKLLEFFLIEMGWDVVNIGVCSNSREIAAAALYHDPLAICISSQNGHGLKDLALLRDHLNMHGLASVRVFVGGNLTVGSEKDPNRVREAFLSRGLEVIESFEQAEEVIRTIATSWRATYESVVSSESKYDISHVTEYELSPVT